jgi:hypothetical protein
MILRIGIALLVIWGVPTGPPVVHYDCPLSILARIGADPVGNRFSGAGEKTEILIKAGLNEHAKACSTKAELKLSSIGAHPTL